jgi:hypothetical protein
MLIPRKRMNIKTYGRSPDLSSFRAAFPFPEGNSGVGSCRLVCIGLTVAGLSRIHTWFPFNHRLRNAVCEPIRGQR